MSDAHVTVKNGNGTGTSRFVVPSGGGTHFDAPTPVRSFALKLLGQEPGESIMMFEETLPAGTESLFRLHRDSDEAAWVLAGEFTFTIGDKATTEAPGGSRSSRAAFRMRGRTPAAKSAGLCFSMPQPLPAALSKRSSRAAHPLTTNAPNSLSAIIGK